MLTTPKTCEGILDMMGPRTLLGGYSSPSQVMSSTMEREVVEKGVDDVRGVKAVTGEWGRGVVKAEMVAMAVVRRRMVSLFLQRPRESNAISSNRVISGSNVIFSLFTNTYF